jgi:hypothetical protein
LRAAKRVFGFLAFLVAIQLVLVGIARLPDGTGAGALTVRAMMGLSIGAVLIVVVRRMLAALADPPPPAPQTVDALETEVVYECASCGTRVRLELAATAKAPRHCGEEMEPSLRAR